MKLDIEKLDSLPYWENRAAYLTRKHGNMYNLRRFDHPWETGHKYNPYKIVQRIIDNNINKSFDMAFHYACTKLKKQDQWIFLREFEPKTRYWFADSYYVEDDIIKIHKRIRYYKVKRTDKQYYEKRAQKRKLKRDSLPRFYLSEQKFREILKMAKIKPLKEKEYKGVSNAWIDPKGNLYKCGYMGHNEWASEYFLNKNKGDHNKASDEIDKICGNSLSSYPYSALHKLGWYRILTWSADTKLLTESDKKLTHEQKDTLMFWCSANNENYEKFVSDY